MAAGYCDPGGIGVLRTIVHLFEYHRKSRYCSVFRAGRKVAPTDAGRFLA